jgi:hypothetical protein
MSEEEFNEGMDFINDHFFLPILTRILRLKHWKDKKYLVKKKGIRTL